MAAWAGFTLPSALLLILLAGGLSESRGILTPGTVHGLKVMAVAVVAQAVWGMARSLCTDAPRIALMLVSACVVLAVPSAWSQVGVIAASGAAGLMLFRAGVTETEEALPVKIRPRTGVVCLSLYGGLLAGLPVLAALFPCHALSLVDSFYRTGSLVFGGGHVVLPLLQAEVVPPGWVTHDTFLAGYGAAQAVPGPLFSFAAFLGASMNGIPSGWAGGLICLLAIFAPSFLLVAGTLPFWNSLRRSARSQAALAGINAAVVGLLLAAFCRPVWTEAIHQPLDFGFALLAFAALMFWRVPPWVVVLGCGFGGWLAGSPV